MQFAVPPPPIEPVEGAKDVEENVVACDAVIAAAIVPLV
jgi:hypothetical protein